MFIAPAFAQTEPPEADEALPADDVVVHEAEGVHTETGVAPRADAGFPPFDASTFPSQLLWLAITFGLFYLFLKRVVLPRISGILEVRSDRIAQDLDQAARMKEEADAAVAAYEQELASARGKANTIGQEARDAAKAKAEVERRKVEAELDVRLSEAERRIAAIKDTAMNDVGAIAEETAGAIVQQLVGIEADRATVAAAVKNAGN